MILKCNGQEIEFDSFKRIDDRTVALYKNDKPGLCCRWKINKDNLSDFGLALFDKS